MQINNLEVSIANKASTNTESEPPNTAPCSGGNDFTKIFYDCKEGTSYVIEIIVDQPGKGGDRDTYEGGLLNPIDVGHTYLRFIKTNTDKTKITGAVGFYPNGDVTPGNLEMKGIIRDDKNRVGEVKATKKITHGSFLKALEYIEKNAWNTYHLNQYNCTDFVIAAAGAAGWNISSNRSEWGWFISGKGHNPGDLGEDLKEYYGGVEITNKKTGNNGSN